MTVDHASIPPNQPQHPLLQDDIGQEQHHHQQQRQRPQSTLTESTTTQANYYNSSQYYASPPPPSPGFAPYSPRHQQQQQRAYSVTAMPSELQHAVLRHQQQLAEQQQQLLAQAAEQPWWQYYYQLYHYHPPPGRKPTVFGPYLLLQTLGEGEFGKVKLGIHIETGHEVAIKLIKKDNIDSTTRMSKVEREINVLRKVRHPYIVKLYDVLETERYIGIILQCASGGELFEYILAHRYLKEKDASRLFAQLISGVHYMHQKHIIHRDLKLENLLLDRNRCVIITDFGFANQFSSTKDDLMSTSCGSPCYAAPELVISEGLYVGSAVDIWSCGVILYAMLCGYLPFDDDPANPDGDNINLLYKYILNTELAFPDYVSPEARDLLRKMLVPDPAKRCTMETIMDHPWLSPHRSLFHRSIHELEREAESTADLPLPTPVQEPTPPPAQPDNKPSVDMNNNNQEDGVVPESKERMATPTNEDDDDDDQMVPQDSMDIDSSGPSEKEKENLVHSESISELAAEDNKTPIVAATNEEQEEEEGTYNNPSSLELPESAHISTEEKPMEQQHEPTEVEEDTNMVDEQQEPPTTPQPRPSASSKKRGSDRIKSLLLPKTTPSSSKRPVSALPSQQSSSPATSGSILHAKFLSSVQRQQQQHDPAMMETTNTTTSPVSTMSTPNGVGHLEHKPLPQTPSKDKRDPSRASLYQPRPPAPQPSTPTPQSSSRGTRRKALSLLVNPMATDSETGKKTISFSSRRSSNRPTAVSSASSASKPSIKVVKEDDERQPMPSASEQPVSRMPPSPTSPDPSSKEFKHKSAGKKLMDWFKKKPMATRDNYPLHHGGATTAATTNKPLGSYGVDFNDSKLRTYHGAVAQNALTSRRPQQVLLEVKQTLLRIGIDVKDDGEYKLKCVRRKRRQQQHPSPSSSTDPKKRRMNGGPRFRKLLRRPSNNPSNTTSTNTTTTAAEDNNNASLIYGDPVVDPGEEVRFDIEVCKIKNLPGLYIVDIRRMRGNVWSYKFLYHTVLGALDLGGKGGYMSTRNPHLLQPPPPQQSNKSSSNHAGEPTTSSNRISMASSSNNSSSVLDDVVPEETAIQIAAS
ncbi:hypothetical protein O0I10_001744 [Lichtheimia ornata]|uniref:non-specific serine/threonine protein kinase n=1 Tax=Lichtheimia ornata TaxID=688661 RepID=A0AAD7Y1I2_9FUNG|nr:uncharacterized protein O0I10_001744 [Lichtheimia ornata]KAJ8662780.1 hypothetical protein O0I10_001744 [Lichtheimia ornata]